MPYSGSIDWNAMPLDFLERVEVVKGPVSSLSGEIIVGTGQTVTVSKGRR